MGVIQLSCTCGYMSTWIHDKVDTWAHPGTQPHTCGDRPTCTWIHGHVHNDTLDTHGM